jgi:hypothetical protein
MQDHASAIRSSSSAPNRPRAVVMLHPQNPVSHQRFSSRMALLCLRPAALWLESAPEHARQACRSIGLLTLNTRTIGNSGTSTRVSLSEAPVGATTIWSQSMTKSKLLVLAAILSAVIATPALAEGETTTRPWSAPVGHRQPRAADVPTSPSASQQTLDQEDANVDRKISNVCRGC